MTAASTHWSAIEYFTWLSAKLDLIEAMPSRRVSLVLRKGFVGGKVGGHDAQQIVAIAGHQIAFEYFFPARDRLGETFEVFFFLPRQFDRDEDVDMQPQRLLVDGGDVTGNDPRSSSSLTRR